MKRNKNVDGLNVKRRVKRSRTRRKRKVERIRMGYKSSRKTGRGRIMLLNRRSCISGGTDGVTLFIHLTLRNHLPFQSYIHHLVSFIIKAQIFPNAFIRVRTPIYQTKCNAIYLHIVINLFGLQSHNTPDRM